MPRKPRIEFDGAFYHVIVRGNQKQKIFRQPSDRQRYLQTISQYKTRYRFHLYAYVLMDNHVHLLVETRAVPLSKVLQGINQSYTMHFNRTYGTVGHLFQGRYKAILCDRDNYLLALIKYIHMNPVRAKVVETPGRYAWSSHRAYVGKDDGGSLVDRDVVLCLFSERRSSALQRYREFMEEESGLKRGDVYATIDQRIQGSETFAARIFDKHVDVPVRKWKKDHTLEHIARGVKHLHGITRRELQSSHRERRLTKARALFSLSAAAAGHRLVDVAGFLNKEPASVAEYAKKRKDLGGEIGALIDYLRRSNTS